MVWTEECRSCFGEECSKFVDQRKQVEMQWLHDPNQSNIVIMNTVRHEANRLSEQCKMWTSRHSGTKEGIFERLVNELENKQEEYKYQRLV